MSRWSFLAIVLLVAGLASGCADDGGKPAADAAVQTDGPKGNLHPCTTPGQSCNAHDSCAIDPVCGNDRICRPRALQNCDDGLTCTVDSCLGRGACEHRPNPGTCALPVKTPKGTVIQCFKKGDRRPGQPCSICDPDVDPKAWSPANGGSCDDGDSCTKDDYCSDGQCKGTYYGDKCQDTLGCTEDLCDGKGGCLGNKLRSDYCLIQGECFKDEQKHPSGSCVQCDVNSSQSQWTNIANTCHIDGKCYNAGDKHPGGCAECDPPTSTSRWTVKGNDCLIDNICKKPGDKDAIACAQCDPATAKYDWTPIAGLCKIHGACFASGAKHPGGCAVCDPTKSSTTWTVDASGTCLINNVCRNSGDKNLSGCGSCQPTVSTAAWSTLSGLCAIDGACYTSGATHPKGCGTCNPSSSSTGWTPSGGGCVIDHTCYAAAAKHPAGCGSCDPTKSATAWTVSANNCLIGGTCRASGATEPGGCGTCDPTKSATAWTKSSSCDVAHSWSTRFGNTSSDYTYALAVDASGNLYVAGYFYNSVNLGGGTISSKGSYDIVLASYTPSGKHRWSKGFGSTSSDIAYGIAVDNAGNVYITGRFYNTIGFGGPTLTSKGSYDIFVASFDSDGKHRWSKSFGSTSSDTGQSVAVDSNGNVYVTGQFYNTVNFGGANLTSKGGYDVFVASYSTTGVHRWSKHFGGTSTDYGYSIAADAGGNAYLTGYFYNTINFGGSDLKSNGSYDIYVASLDPNGKHRWSTSFGGTSSDYGYGIAVGKNGNAVVTGSFYNTITVGTTKLTSKGSRDIYVAAFTAAGAPRWAKGFGSTSTDYGYAVAVDSAGNPYVVGYFYSSVDFGGGAVTSKGGYDVFVAAYTADGAHRWARGFGSTSSDYGRTIAVAPSGAVYAGGNYRNIVDFGGGALTSAGSYDAFIVKLE